MSAIDPGIEEPIRNTANDNNDGAVEQEPDDYKAPSKWWFASTICPLLAATFGPIANGFSICALVYTWRSYVPPGLQQASGKSIRDPPWLLAVNAVSLGCALIGNGALLLNMARRVRFAIAQPITIAGFSLAGILLIADMAAISSSPTYFLTDPTHIQYRALTGAYYYAIWAAGIYIIIALLGCVTVHGAKKGHYSKGFDLTPAQRTLMLQTMMFVGYLLLGALIFSSIEGWKYLDGVYWAQVTLLTIGLGDYTPTTRLSRGLLFPFAVFGILMVGLVVGSIRTLVLERGKEKIAARITEKRRQSAVHNVDERRQTIKVSWFTQAEFITDPALTPAQRREEEFHIMRRVQHAAERERRYIALSMSLFFALLLWLVGAAIFMICEKHEQGWTYFDSLDFTFIVLMTIGYGDLVPKTNAGKSFFVLWSLLAVPSLTILISNMGDTFVKWFSDLTNWVASFTVLPEKAEKTGSGKSNSLLGRLTDRANDVVSRFTAPGLLGETSSPPRLDGKEHHYAMLERLAKRLERHVGEEELEAANKADAEGDELLRDIHFYHYVLSRELRNVQKDVEASPPKQYSWHDWEYYLKLIGNEDEPEDFEEQENPDGLVPEPLRAPALELHGADGVVDRQTEKKNAYAWRGPKNQTSIDPLVDWSWLSNESPLMSTKAEAEWILERLSAALVRELNLQRKGIKRKPPISMGHVVWRRS